MIKKMIFMFTALSLISALAQAEYIQTRSNAVFHQLGDQRGFVDTHTIEGIAILQTESSLGDGSILVDGATKITISGSVAEHIWQRALTDGETTIQDKYGKDTLSYRGWLCSAALPSSADSFALQMAIRFDYLMRNADYINCSRDLLD